MPVSVARSPLDLIGHTPVVRLNRLPGKQDAEVWAKLENYNPGGSVKDRICLAMIERAEREGRLKPGDTIVEPTSGNTGIGLALVAAVKGYKLILTMPDTMSEERRSLLSAYGAQLVLTPDTRGMHGAIAKAEELVRANPGYFMPQQFSNAANPEMHHNSTGPELVEQLERIDAFVAGVGTGGTITGVGGYLREKFDGKVKIVAVEPKSSPVLSGGEPGFHKIQGIGAGFVPEILDTHMYDEVIPVSDEDATLYARRLAREEGLLVGISSGAACCAALQVARQLGPGKLVAVIFCDTGERYLTTDLFQAEGHLRAMDSLQDKLDRLRATFAAMDSVMVAFSGGVDSSFLLKVAHETAGSRVLALTTTSPTMPDEDLASARAIAELIGARHLIIGSNELEIPGYAENPLNRCYLCKHNLFTVCEEQARELAIEHIVDGLNLDDLRDYRPGMQAASEKRVRHPLVEAKLSKQEIRELSRMMGLPTWDRPASPCLSSRFPYGTQITLERLQQVSGGEKLLRSLGFRIVRVRYHGEVARLEVGRDEMPRLLEPQIGEILSREFRKLGFRFVTLDLGGFRSGSLNEGVVASGSN